jgi:hypothetical protein
MNKPTIRIHNTETNEIIDREMTDAEFTQYQADQKVNKSLQAEIDAKANAKAALLKKLGITEAEAELLLA